MLALGSVLLVSCASPRKRTIEDPVLAIQQACALGGETRQVKGTVWLKAKSKEASGQFPANVVAIATAPRSLKLEVTNLVGATQALIRVDGQSFTIDSPDPKVKSQKGQGTWGGIPLRWATDLFLGRVPCPSTLEGARVSANAGEVTVESREGEKFIYTFRDHGGVAWAETLHWDKNGKNGVDFVFDEPDDATGSPKKWDARSDRGEVKARWREREATR